MSGTWLSGLRYRLSGDTFRIRFQPPDRVDFDGSVPQARRGLIAEFLGRDLGSSTPFLIRGRKGRGGSIELRVAGQLTAGEIQRLRNFLLQVLD